MLHECDVPTEMSPRVNTEQFQSDAAMVRNVAAGKKIR